MSQKRIMVVLLALVVALAAAPLVSLAQAPQGQQPPAGRGAGGGQGRGRGDGAPRGDGQGRGDGRGAQGRGGAAAQAQGQAIKMIKPGLFMVTGAGGNSTVRVTNEGVLLVDTKNLGDQFYNDLVAQIKTVSQQ